MIIIGNAPKSKELVEGEEETSSGCPTSCQCLESRPSKSYDSSEPPTTAFLSEPFRPVYSSSPPRRTSSTRTSLILLCVVSLSCWTPSYGHPTYANAFQIFKDKLDPGRYHTAVRPLKNQSKVLELTVGFDIIAIVDIDDIKEQFILDGFFTLSWTDEMIAWIPKHYGNIKVIKPYPAQVWRPRLVLANTLNNQDAFQAEYVTTIAHANGTVHWFPGSLIPTSCNLELTHYPFDRQTCHLKIYVVEASKDYLRFIASRDKVGEKMFVESGEWDLIDTNLGVEETSDIPIFKISFYLRRRPSFIVVNVIAPVIMLSFLNLLVFVIPAESGEKISYGITVLLTLAVFLSIVSEMLPRTSDDLPLITVYLMALLINAVLTVIVVILIDYFFYHLDIEEEASLRYHAAESVASMVFPDKNRCPTECGSRYIKQLRSEHRSSDEIIALPRRPLMNDDSNENNMPSKCASEFRKHEVRWKLVGRHVDFISFIVFVTIWTSVTIGFLVAIAS